MSNGQNNKSSGSHRIVVGIDGSPSSNAALGWAIRQAELTGSTLQALTTWEWPSGFGWPMPFPSDYDPASDAQKMLDDVLEPLKKDHPHVTVSPVVVEGHPAPILVEASRGAELLVVGNRGHGGFAGMLLGSVSKYCASNAHCPTLIFRDDE